MGRGGENSQAVTETGRILDVVQDRGGNEGEVPLPLVQNTLPLRRAAAVLYLQCSSRATMLRATKL